MLFHNYSLSLLTQILKAAMYLHSGNVIHRDQKVYLFNTSFKELSGSLQVTLINCLIYGFNNCLSFWLEVKVMVGLVKKEKPAFCELKSVTCLS